MTMLGDPVTLTERVMTRVQPLPNGCWSWTGAKNEKGYGQFSFRGVTQGAHRLMWEIANGEPVPEGLELDHLCRNRGCVNPDHLEPVTHAENIRRGMRRRGTDTYNGAKTHCPQGHPYDEHNTYTRAGRRQCKACRRVRVREYMQGRRRGV